MKIIGTKTGKRQYELRQELGRGSFGKVYDAGCYAIKEINTANKNIQSNLDRIKT